MSFKLFLIFLLIFTVGLVSAVMEVDIATLGTNNTFIVTGTGGTGNVNGTDISIKTINTTYINVTDRLRTISNTNLIFEDNKVIWVLN